MRAHADGGTACNRNQVSHHRRGCGQLTGAGSKLTFLPLPKDDPLQRKPNIDLAKEKLGWEPKVALEEGLQRTIDYFKSVDLDTFRVPTDHTAHKSSEMSKQ